MRSSAKLISKAIEIGRAMKTGSEGKGFKLAASSSVKSYKWGVNVNIPTRKCNTTSELFREGLDLNYKHPRQSALQTSPGCPSIPGMPKPSPT